MGKPLPCDDLILAIGCAALQNRRPFPRHSQPACLTSHFPRTTSPPLPPAIFANFLTNSQPKLLRLDCSRSLNSQFTANTSTSRKMKYAIVAVGAFAAAATAQSLSACAVSSTLSLLRQLQCLRNFPLTTCLPQSMCLNNMLQKAPSLGCSSTDVACLCKNADFGYGLHDCTAEACGPADVAAIVAYSTQYCAGT